VEWDKIEWKEIRRHKSDFSWVTIGDVRDLAIYKGRLIELIGQPPDIENSKSPFRDVFKALYRRHIKNRRQSSFLIKKINAIEAALIEPAELSNPSTGETFDFPLINFYAYLVDLFASEHGWSEQRIEKIPWASINEYRLAIEVRRVRQSNRAVMENNPNDKGIEALNMFPFRITVYSRKKRFEQYLANLNKVFN